MQRAAQGIHLAVAWLFVVALVVQVFLAGLGVFEGPASFETHRTLGFTLELLPIVLFVAAILARLGRLQVGLAALEFGLFILQSVFVAARDSSPAVAALHPVNGFLILLVAIVIARDATVRWRTRPVAPPAAPAA